MEEIKNSTEYSNTEKISKIREYQKQGYVFHGSPHDLDIIKPMNAKDHNRENAFNNDTAIFGSNNPQVSIFSLLNPKDMQGYDSKGRWSANTKSDNNITARIPITLKPLVENYTGFLYVLPPNSFTEKYGWTVKSYEEVKPIEKIPVNFEDFISLGGKVEWKDKN